MNPRDRRQHLHDGNIGPNELQRDNVLLERASVKLSLEDVVMPVNERLTPSEELPSDICEGAVGRKMPGVGDGIPGIRLDEGARTDPPGPPR